MCHFTKWQFSCISSPWIRNVESLTYDTHAEGKAGQGRYSTSYVINTIGTNVSDRRSIFKQIINSNRSR